MSSAPAGDLYDLLGVSHSATCHQIQQLRRPLSRKYHSDNGTKPDGERMARVNHAIDVLGDPVKRRHYDDTLWETRHRVAIAEADRVRQARTREVGPMEAAAFASALAGADRRGPAPSVPPPGGGAAPPRGSVAPPRRTAVRI